MTQYPCVCVPYLEGTEPVVLNPQPWIWEFQALVNSYSPSRSGQSPNEMVNEKNDPLFSYISPTPLMNFTATFSVQESDCLEEDNFSAQILLLCPLPDFGVSYKLKLLYFDK
jgi:hypothetical protein